MKEQRGCKPPGRLKEVSAVRHKDKGAVEVSKSVSRTTESKPVPRQALGQTCGGGNGHEQALPSQERESPQSRSVLPGRAPSRTCRLAQNNGLKTQCRVDRTSSRLENHVSKPGGLSRFDDKFLHRHSSVQDTATRPQDKRSMDVRTSDNAKSGVDVFKLHEDVRWSSRDKSCRQVELHKRSCIHEADASDQVTRPVIMSRQQHHQLKMATPIAQSSELWPRRQLQERENDLDQKDTLCHVSQELHARLHRPLKTQGLANNGKLEPLVETPSHQYHSQGSQDTRDCSFVPHQTHMQAMLHRNIHEHETKLMQRQKYLQQKVRSRKMLLGSVISSDMSFSSETCRNWHLSAMIGNKLVDISSYMAWYKQSWGQQAVLSADSGISMGEASSGSRRNSETEPDDQLVDDIPTIVADVGEIISRRMPSRCQKCQRLRSETKDACSQHSHPPSDEESTLSSPLTESLGVGAGSLVSTALDVLSPSPIDRIYQCRVVRDKNNYGTMFYPVYRMYLELDGRPELLLLTARKRKKCSTSKYLICIGNDELRRKSSSLVGKLRSNLVGTRFHLATYGKMSGPNDYSGHPKSSDPFKMDSLLLFYETNILGTKGPRRMKVFLPEERQVEGGLNLLESVRRGSTEGVLMLVNKEPEWDRETLSHILYFEGRVTKSSVKNFQLIKPPDDTTVLLQFGKIGRNEFTLDYHTPFNAVQAFAIALSSFDGKIACE